MTKAIKHIILGILISPLLLTGCSDLFDKGDTEKAYDGSDVVAFADLQSTASEGSSTTLEIQLISSEGLATSDINVTVSVAGDSEAPASTYSLSSNSVTIASGSASAELTVNFPANDDINSGDEVALILTISSSDVTPAENLKSSTIFIEGAD